MNNDQQNGYGIIEILVASTIGVVLFLSVNSFLSLSLKTAIDDMHKVEALNLARATLEEARAVRDEDQLTPTVDPKLGWNNINALTRDTEYHFTQSGAGPFKWEPLLGAQTIGKYTVWFTVSDVSRAVNGDIAVGGTLDTGTIKVMSYVDWTSSRGAQEISIYEYLTDIK